MRILVHPNPPQASFRCAKAGAVFQLCIHELRYPAELRANAPRVRLLEHGRLGWVLCELLDPWPDAPEYWPPEWAPGAPVHPNFGHCPSGELRSFPGR